MVPSDTSVLYKIHAVDYLPQKHLAVLLYNSFFDETANLKHDIAWRLRRRESKKSGSMQHRL